MGCKLQTQTQLTYTCEYHILPCKILTYAKRYVATNILQPILLHYYLHVPRQAMQDQFAPISTYHALAEKSVA